MCFGQQQRSVIGCPADHLRHVKSLCGLIGPLYIQSRIVCFSAFVGSNRRWMDENRSRWQRQVSRLYFISHTTKILKTASLFSISGHLSSVILLIPDQGDRWCWSGSQWSLGRSLDRPPVHQSPVHLMLMDRGRKSQRRTHSDVMRTCPHIRGWESNPKPACSDVTVATTKSFLQAALEKYIYYTEAFPQRRIEWRTSYGVNCTRNQTLW